MLTKNISLKELTLTITFLFFATIVYSQSIYQKYFEQFNISGSTTIYDYKKQKWIFTDSIDAKRETVPASTFKIINSLIAIEENAIKDEYETLKWDGIERTFFGTKMPSWNKDTDLKTAYKNSTIWYYVEMAKRIGTTKYKHYLKKCNYGNLTFSEKGTDFWNYGDYGINPKNQIEFLVKLYENKLPFSKTTINKVKQIMISEKDNGIIFRDKSGWTKKNGTDIGWWIGYVETANDIFFFATRLIKKVNDNNPDFSKARIEITKAILKDLNAI